MTLNDKKKLIKQINLEIFSGTWKNYSDPRFILSLMTG